LRNVIFRFPTGIDYYPKKRVFWLNVFDENPIEVLKFQYRAGCEDSFLEFEDKLPFFNEFSDVETETDAAKEMMKMKRISNEQENGLVDIQSEEYEVRNCDDCIRVNREDLQMLSLLRMIHSTEVGENSPISDLQGETNTHNFVFSEHTMVFDE
jgi:hypothetical protein